LIRTTGETPVPPTARHMRYLAIDLGDKRTGLATGNDLTGMVAPASTLEIQRGDALIEAIVREIERHNPDRIILGLPLNMDGSEGPRAKIVRDFAADLAKVTAVEIICHDERLSSFEADQAMAQTGRTHRQKKRLRDALAAAAILPASAQTKIVINGSDTLGAKMVPQLAERRKPPSKPTRAESLSA